MGEDKQLPCSKSKPCSLKSHVVAYSCGVQMHKSCQMMGRNHCAAVAGRAGENMWENMWETPRSAKNGGSDRAAWWAPGGQPRSMHHSHVKFYYSTNCLSVAVKTIISNVVLCAM